MQLNSSIKVHHRTKRLRMLFIAVLKIAKHCNKTTQLGDNGVPQLNKTVDYLPVANVDISAVNKEH